MLKSRVRLYRNCFFIKRERVFKAILEGKKEQGEESSSLWGQHVGWDTDGSPPVLVPPASKRPATV